MLGLPGSWVCRLTFRSYRLRRPKENYCDCALVIPDEHLSRESRKLTVMIQRETGQPLDRLPECLEFLRFDEGPLPGQAHTRPKFGEARCHQGLYSSPTFELLWLSESDKAL